MRILLAFSVLAVFLTAACSKPDEMTAEEQVMTKVFTGFVAAGTYDSVCGGNILAKTDVKKNPAFSKYLGNRQLFGARMGTLWKVRHPDGTPEQGVISLIETEKKIAAKITATLKEKGCDSDEAKDGQKMYDLYTKAHPAKINAILDKAIVKEGGTVTPPQMEPVKKSEPEKKK